MFKTKNDLSETIRGKAIELLNACLADAIDLQTQTKQAHWNVKALNFIALHQLFDGINEEVEDYVDDIAERAVQLGGVAEGDGPQGGGEVVAVRIPGEGGGRPQPRRGAVVRPGGVRRGGAEGH